MKAAWKAACSCGWQTEWLPKASDVSRALKKHHDENPHRDYVDVPMF